jgi:hypothetical protein
MQGKSINTRRIELRTMQRESQQQQPHSKQQAKHIQKTKHKQ